MSLIAKGANNVSLYVIKENKNGHEKYFIFRLPLELLLAILRQFPAILLSIITPYLCLRMILDKCTIFTCVVIPSKIMYLISFRYCSTSACFNSERFLHFWSRRGSVVPFSIHSSSLFQTPQKLPSCFSSTFHLFGPREPNGSFIPLPPPS